jgi:hypothetical protein
MNRILLSLCTICLFVISCQKELSGDYGIIPPGGSNGGGLGGTPPAQLLGVWKFDSMVNDYRSETVVTALGTSAKTKSWGIYGTIQNTGTMTLNSDGTAKSDNFGYALDDLLQQVTYLDDVLLDSSEVPIVNPYFSTTGTSNFKMKGTDSIFFYNGSLAGSQDGMMGYKITGNKLSLSVLAVVDSSFASPGMSGRVSTRQKSTIYFTK